LSVSIIWFRRDLRLADNPAFVAAVKAGVVLPVFIMDDKKPKAVQLGGASRVWLHHSLEKLDLSLKGHLNVYVGDAATILVELVKRHAVSTVCWNTCCEPWQDARDQVVAKQLEAAGVRVEVFQSNYLWGMDQVLKDDGTFYRVFTPFKKRAFTIAPPDSVAAPRNKKLMIDTKNKITIGGLDLLPTINWYKEVLKDWKIGEKSAIKKLDGFIEDGLSSYKKGRDFPSMASTSSLSPHLHFGEISPRQVWQTVQSVGSHFASQVDIEHFLSELTWREFSAYLLHHFPKLPHKNFNAKFDGFPWQSSTRLLNAWKTGQTGYPLVDAGMRELWQTGYMHNRVRMVVASFLVKNLLIHWHKGRDWFNDCLFDADLANNSASWQWVAGCGVDAAPYFRIFNPTTQGEKFDPQGFYTRQYVPELKNLPDKYLYKPWAAPAAVLEEVGVELGKTYPEPIIDLKTSREAALKAYKQLG
jgi:deoxyribodipyrimidine photo-lyase